MTKNIKTYTDMFDVAVDYKINPKAVEDAFKDNPKNKSGLLEQTKYWLKNTAFPKRSPFEEYLRTHWSDGKKIGNNPIDWFKIDQNDKDKIRYAYSKHPEWIHNKNEIININKEFDILDNSRMMRRKDDNDLNFLTNSALEKIRKQRIEDENKHDEEEDYVGEPNPDADFLFDPYTFFYYDDVNYDEDAEDGTPDVKYVGTRKLPDNSNDLFIRNRGTRYEHTDKSGNCALITFFQFVRATRIEFTPFYKNFLEKIIINNYTKRRQLLIGESFHVIRVLWDGIINGQFKTFGAFTHNASFSDKTRQEKPEKKKSKD